MSWIIAWIAFVPLFLALEKKSKLKAFLLSYIIGVIYWLCTIYWLVHVTLPGLIVFSLYLALYFGFFGLCFRCSKLLTPNCKLLFIPCAWVLLEYTRSHLLTGFGWALLGYSQYHNLPVIQIADITGAYGVSFLVMMVNVAIWQFIRTKNKKPIIFTAVCLLFVLAYGYFRLHQTYAGRKLRVAVIQGNIPQELKWLDEEKDKNLARHVELAIGVVKDNPDLIVWPETAVTAALEDDSFSYSTVGSLAKEIHIPILLGSMRREGEDYYNSAFLISCEGNIIQHYDKLHLVPFGEYIPLRKQLRFLEAIVPIGDFRRGGDYTVFQLPTPKSQPPTKFSVLICFEDIFPELARNFVKNGAGFLVNITNDAWFGRTSSPYQHLQASVFRAVENRLPVVRSANTGVSGFISPKGEIISLVKDTAGRNIFVSGYDTQEITVSKEKKLTFYTRYGDVFVLVCLIIFTLETLSLLQRKVFPDCLGKRF